MAKNIKTSKIILTTLYLGVLTLPFSAVAIKCGYVLLNKNAYQNYSTSEKIEKAINTTPTSETIENDRYYNLELKYQTYNNEQIFKESDTVETLELIAILPNKNIKEYDYNEIYFYAIKADYISITKNITAPTTLDITIDDPEDTTTSIKAVNVNILVKTLNINNLTDYGKTILKPLTENEYIYTSETIEKTNLDNVFYNATEELSNKQLFSWSKNTMFYKTINNLTTNLKITTDTIPVILSYWLTITLIYMIIKLIITSLNMLTDIINARIGVKK